MLETYKEALKELFKYVQRIMSYRSFMLVADNGNVSLISPVPLPEI